MLITQKQLLGANIPGTQFTNQVNIVIKGIQINWINNTGKPEFYVQIDNNRPFIIYANAADSFHHNATIKDADDIDTKFYSEYGLMPTGNDAPLKEELYKQILDTLTGICNGI